MGASQVDELEEIRSLGMPLGSGVDLDPVIERIGDARYVLLGEASHGTSEFYEWRSAITRRLVADKGFSFVAVEGDWPDCFYLNRWVKGRVDRHLPPSGALGRFRRWPTWMWANQVVSDFLGWLRDYNERTGNHAGFYGLDVYSLWDSLDAVLRYLTQSHPDALPAALSAVRCFEPYGEEPSGYSWAADLVPASCEDGVVDLLVSMRDEVTRFDSEPEAELDARQNAEVVAGAETYYRTMMRADHESWNVRDRHMVATLDRLMDHHGPSARGVVWAHNTHVGDARATDMGEAGMVNIGQLVREAHADDGVVLIGFAGYHGQVIAGDHWGAPGRRVTVPPPPAGSHEALLHEALRAPALLVFPDDRASPWLAARRGHRAIGVVYNPVADPYGNWVPTVMGGRYDTLLSFDATRALRPVQVEAPAPDEEHATFPWAV